jgi:hypothetical protein
VNLDWADEQQRTLARALRRADLTTNDLWLRYFALGGDVAEIDVDAYVHGLFTLPEYQRDILAHAVNERLDELIWTHRAAYSKPTRDGRPRSRALAALVRLLEDSELAPPERLAAVTEAAAHALDVRITMYLVDYEQQRLCPVPSRDTPPLLVDSTPAGRAFREVRILPSGEASGQPRLWVPLLDGIERLGVLDVAFTGTTDLHNPGLRTQCRWISMLLGHLVTLLTRYGDGLDVVRRGPGRSVAGELVWSLLPPLTAGVDDFVITGALEPRDDVSGAAFDYALTETTATLMILDAAGHQPRRSLLAATVIAAHRSARHAGHDLLGQARVIDEAITTQFGDGSSVAVALAEIDLPTGRLRYLNAGHPAPLVMRSGTVAIPLTGSRHKPLGLGDEPVTLAEETLHPDDWLVLHTAGVTAARDLRGDRFGEARLGDFLRREAEADRPPSETARRFIRAVMAHQDGDHEDDATVVLARWATPRSAMT